MSEPQAVEAEIIEPVNLAKPPEPSVTFTLPTAKVQNMEEVEGFVSRIEEYFSGIEIDPTDADQVKALKGVRADANKVAKAIDDKRKEMDKAVKGAMSEADGALNGLRDRVKKVYDTSGEQIAEADRLWLTDRKALLAEEYAGIAPDLVDLIPLESFLLRDPKMAQKSYSPKKATATLDDIVIAVTAERESVLRLPNHTQADMVYCRTLSVAEAVKESDRVTAQQEAAEAHKAEAAKLEASRLERSQQMAAKAVSAHFEEVEPEPKKVWTLIFEGTSDQAHRIHGYVVESGAKGLSLKGADLA